MCGVGGLIADVQQRLLLEETTINHIENSVCVRVKVYNTTHAGLSLIVQVHVISVFGGRNPPCIRVLISNDPRATTSSQCRCRQFAGDQTPLQSQGECYSA